MEKEPISMEERRKPDALPGSQIPTELAEHFGLMDRDQAALKQPLKKIKGRITDLEKDWQPRSYRFWTETLDECCTLRSATRQLTEWLIEPSALSGDIPPCFLSLRYELMIPAHQVADRVDEIGISITSYLSQCDSFAEKDLGRRQRIMRELQKLTEYALRLISGLGLQNRTQCIEKHQELTKMLRRVRRQEKQ